MAPKPGAPLNTTDRIITIFLRGAQDGVHTVVPVGDTTLGTARGATTALVTTVPLAGSTFAALNDDYSILANGAASADGRGEIAWIHQCGNPTGTRSHFTEQQIYETADVQPQTNLNNEGFLTRLQTEAAPAGTSLWGASVSNAMQRMFRSTDPTRIMAHVKTQGQYTFRASINQLYNNGAVNAYFLPGGVPGPASFLAGRSETQLRTQLNNLHLTQAQPAGSIEDYLRQTALFAEASETAISGVSFTHDAANFPRTPAEIAAVFGAGSAPTTAPQTSFFRRAEEAMHIAEQTKLPGGRDRDRRLGHPQRPKRTPECIGPPARERDGRPLSDDPELAVQLHDPGHD